MDMRLIVEIEINKNDRSYVFKLPHGAPLGECHDAVLEVLNKIVEMAKQNADKIQPADPVAPVESPNS